MIRNAQHNHQSLIERLRVSADAAVNLHRASLSIEVIVAGWTLEPVRNFARFIQAAACTAHIYSPPIAWQPYDVARWSVLRSFFVHKRAWSQFERRTFTRVVHLYDVHPDIVSKFMWYAKRNAPADIFITFKKYEYLPLKCIIGGSSSLNAIQSRE